MTRIFSIVACFISLLLVPACSVSALEGTVVKVIDGDSLMVQWEGKVSEVRLYGIDTPEYRQPFSNKAKQFTRKLALGQLVIVEEKDIDKYGRTVALVRSRGKLVNRELVRVGLAWYYSRYCHEQPLCGELKLLEQKAKKEKRGLWRGRNPVSPRKWKKQGAGANK